MAKDAKAKVVKKTKTKAVKKGYFKEIREELKKVNWPDKKEMTKYTLAVVIFIGIFGLYFYGLDAVFAWIKGIIS